MKDLLALIFEYRRVLSRRDLMDGVLSDEASQRLSALEDLLGDRNSGRRDSRRSHARTEVEIPATLLLGPTSQPVSVVDMGGGGLRVSPAPTVRKGERARVRIVHAETGRVYEYPVRVRWFERSATSSSMGMPFNGPPKCLPLHSRI